MSAKLALDILARDYKSWFLICRLCNFLRLEPQFDQLLLQSLQKKTLCHYRKLYLQWQVYFLYIYIFFEVLLVSTWKVRWHSGKLQVDFPVSVHADNKAVLQADFKVEMQLLGIRRRHCPKRKKLCSNMNCMWLTLNYLSVNMWIVCANMFFDVFQFDRLAEPIDCCAVKAMSYCCH